MWSCFHSDVYSCMTIKNNLQDEAELMYQGAEQRRYDTGDDRRLSQWIEKIE